MNRIIIVERQLAPISISFLALLYWFEGIELLQAAFYLASSPQGFFSLQIAIFTEPTAHHFLTVKLLRGFFMASKSGIFLVFRKNLLPE